MPRLSASLGYYVAGDAVIGGTLHPVHGSLGAAEIDEARRMLPKLEDLCRAPTAALIAAWCRILAPHLRGAPANENAVLCAVEGIARACGDLPHAVWTMETAAEALRSLEWWPPPAKVRALLLSHARRYARLRDRLARIVAAADQVRSPLDPRWTSARSGRMRR